MKLSEFYNEYCTVNGYKPELTEHIVKFLDDKEYRDNYIIIQTIKTRRSPTIIGRSAKILEEIMVYNDLLSEYIKTIPTK